MGKGTIIRHLGEGQYRVRLNRSNARIDSSLARVATDLSVLQGRIESAWQELQDAETRLSAAIGDINAAIAAISDRIQELADTVREARELVEQRTDELRTAQESLDYLERAKKDDPDSVTDEQIRIATEQRDAKQALLDAANVQLTSATDAWNARDVDVKDQDAKIIAAAKLREELTAERLAYNSLLLEKSSLEKHKAWLESKRKADPELDAWCADLTEDLEGEVGTIEIPGERNTDSDPALIRPGYEGRAAYQPKDAHQALIDAKQAAFTESIRAHDRLDAAQSALDVEASKRRELQGRLANLLSQPEPDQAESVFLQGQVEASDALIPVLEARKATMDEALAAAQAVFDAASQSLSAARAADANPRLSDGILQSIPASPGPFSSFFNQALLPAWQKWRPMYRVGTITELTGDRCAVVLDPATSSQQSIDVNHSGSLSNVPIDYMDCDGQAFKVGDRVVLEFVHQDPSHPKVIGFEREPKPCTLRFHGLSAIPCTSLSPQGFGVPLLGNGDTWGRCGIATLTSFSGSTTLPVGATSWQLGFVVDKESPDGMDVVHGAAWQTLVSKGGPPILYGGNLSVSIPTGDDGKTVLVFSIRHQSGLWLAENTWWIYEVISDAVADFGSIGTNPFMSRYSDQHNQWWFFVVSGLYHNGRTHAYRYADSAAGHGVQGLVGLAARGRTLVAIVAVIVPGQDDFTGAFRVLTWDAPYDVAVARGDFFVDDLGGNPLPLFGNASGTRFSGIGWLNRQETDSLDWSYWDWDQWAPPPSSTSKQLMVLFPHLIHVDLDAAFKPTVSIVEGTGCDYRGYHRQLIGIRFMYDDTIPDIENRRYLWVYKTRNEDELIEEHTMMDCPVAVGYVGDEMRLLTADFHYLNHELMAQDFTVVNTKVRTTTLAYKINGEESASWENPPGNTAYISLLGVDLRSKHVYWQVDNYPLTNPRGGISSSQIFRNNDLLREDVYLP